MASYFWREIFYVPFPETPGKIPGNSGSTELRKEFGTTLNVNNLAETNSRPVSELKSKNTFNILSVSFS